MTMPQEIERRAGVPAEIRADSDGIRVSGYAAVFNEPASIGGHFREVVAPGAFRAALSRDDVPFLIMHAGLPLARTKSGTLTLTEDSKGLRMEAMLDPDDPDVQRIVPKMKRGDLSKMSFGFRAVKQTWDDAQDPPLRTLQEVVLHDVDRCRGSGLRRHRHRPAQPRGRAPGAQRDTTSSPPASASPSAAPRPSTSSGASRRSEHPAPAGGGASTRFAPLVARFGGLFMVNRSKR
jgi:uncharacterized protein